MFYRKTILRYLFARRGFTRLVTLFAGFGVVLGVAALIVVMSVMSGFREELLSRILGVTGHGMVTQPGLTLEEARTMVPRLTQLEAVSAAEPYVMGQAMVLRGGQATGLLVRGVDPALSRENLFAKSLIDGALENLNQTRHIAIGKGLAMQLRVAVGDSLTLVSPQGNRTIAGFIPRMIQVRIGAVFDVGMHQYDSGLLYMNIADAQAFFDTGNTVSAIDIRLHNPEATAQTAAAIAQAAGEFASFQDWKVGNRQFFQALQVERAAMFIILSLIVVVAAFNVITGQMMLVNGKTQDIAILRTMGATRWQILVIFFMNGGLIGLLGTGAGVGIGLLVVAYLQPIVSTLEKLFGVAIFSGEVYFLDRLPAVLVWQDVAFIAAVSFGLCVLASIYPAWRAARMEPVEILRRG